jgi:rod shape-determining protein MreD
VTDGGLRSWSGGLAYAALAAVLLAAPLLPLGAVPRGWAAPDVLLAVTLGWAARRPDTLPVLLVGGVFLLADLLFQRPPGLYTALVIVATEWLRRRSQGLRKGGFLAEWVAVAGTAAAVEVVNRLFLGAAMTPQAPLGLTLIQVLLTIALYPAIAGLARAGMGLRRPLQGEVDARGHPL